jgi:hypothetical protein
MPGNVTNTMNILLTLSVGVIAFAVNILVAAKSPIGYRYRGEMPEDEEVLRRSKQQ